MIQRVVGVGGRNKHRHAINCIWVRKLTSASGGDWSIIEIHVHALHQGPRFVINCMSLWDLGRASSVT